MATDRYQLDGEKIPFVFDVVDEGSYVSPLDFQDDHTLLEPSSDSIYTADFDRDVVDKDIDDRVNTVELPPFRMGDGDEDKFLTPSINSFYERRDSLHRVSYCSTSASPPPTLACSRRNSDTRERRASPTHCPVEKCDGSCYMGSRFNCLSAEGKIYQGALRRLLRSMEVSEHSRHRLFLVHRAFRDVYWPWEGKGDMRCGEVKGRIMEFRACRRALRSSIQRQLAKVESDEIPHKLRIHVFNHILDI